MLKIAIGADHRGYDLKEYLKDTLAQQYHCIDVGTSDHTRVDYPIYVKSVCSAILKKEADVGILLCGSGIGMSIAANRFQYIYAALVWNRTIAQAAKADNNANILVFPADYINYEEAHASVLAWLLTPFKGGRYKERLDTVDNLIDTI